MRAGGEPNSADLNGKCQGQIMIGTVKSQGSSHLYLRRPFWGHSPGNVFWQKLDRWEALTLKDFLVHFVVACMIAAIAAGRVDNHVSTCSSIGRIKMDHS